MSALTTAQRVAVSVISTYYAKWFDEQVAEIRRQGIAPKCIRKPKSNCTPRQWAAHREYMRIRYLDPRCREMHKANQIKYLASKR